MCLHSEMCSINARTSRANASSIKADITYPKDKGGRMSPKKRKPRRVLYPAVVRKYLPREKKDPIKRWLVILGLVVFLQIYFEDVSQCDADLFKTVPTENISDGLMENSTFPSETRSLWTGMMASLSAQQPTNASQTYVFVFMSADSEENSTFSRNKDEQGRDRDGVQY